MSVEANNFLYIPSSNMKYTEYIAHLCVQIVIENYVICTHIFSLGLGFNVGFNNFFIALSINKENNLNIFESTSAL
mgnify:CR=1 FL=1